MFSTARRGRRNVNVWPGYVDALAALLMLVIFVLLVFTFAQFMLSQILSNQEGELSQLSRRLNELTAELGLEQERNRALKGEITNLSDLITGLTEDKFDLAAQVDQLKGQSDKDRERIAQQLLSMASLQQDIDKLRQLREELEQRIGALSGQLSTQTLMATQLRDRSKSLEARLAEQSERTHLAQKEIDEKAIRIEALSALVGSQKKALEEERQLSAGSQAEVALLAQQISALKRQLKEIDLALKQAESDKQAQAEKIENLGKRLNIELARRVNELERYRSEFFGQLRTLLADNPYIQIKGDRFVFQAELLFESGSADLGAEGRRQLDTLARVLGDVIDKIPAEIDWILRIDGHTDRVPIRSGRFSSNWELSASRALSVVRYLAEKGIPSQRMAAAGFGEFHPLDKGTTAEAYSRNRRIEIKLTAR